MPKNYKYKAFISYSHQNEKFSNWLHNALETYRIPKDLFKKFPDIPEKLYPIFRDREELPTSSDLSKNITEALMESAYLIIICSPQAATSIWVNKEIINFKTIHENGENRILTIIIDGEPNAIDKEQYDNNLECFPSALKYKVIDGKITTERVEPIAADIRKNRDNKEYGKLKLIAGLLGIDFEILYQREKKRKKRTKIIWTMSTLAIIILLGTIFFYALQQKTLAKEQTSIAIKR